MVEGVEDEDAVRGNAALPNRGRHIVSAARQRWWAHVRDGRRSMVFVGEYKLRFPALQAGSERVNINNLSRREVAFRKYI